MIPITKPVFGEEELLAIQRPVESGWVVQGPFVRQFEERFAEYTGTQHCVATTSCTTALHLAVAVLGLRPGAEVIVPAFTWVSTANVVEYMGATPIFCDVDVDTFNVDPRQIEALVTPRTVGMIPVHLFGLCADMAPILEIARKHRLWVVEDAACAFGGWYQGRHAGTFGDMGCFSFHPRKSITTGEGGMITTANADWQRQARSLRDHGASRSDHERHTEDDSFLLADYEQLGYNYRMTDIQGALGCAQMERAAWILARRAECAQVYDTLLDGLEWLQRPLVPPDYEHGYQAYVCLFRPESLTLANAERLYQRRNAVMRRLERVGIATRPGTHAPVIQGYYREKYALRPEAYPNAYLADRVSLALPLYPQMTEAEQTLVVGELRRAFEGA